MDVQPEKTPGLDLPQPTGRSTNGFSAHHTHGREIKPITMKSMPPLPDPASILAPQASISVAQPSSSGAVSATTMTVAPLSDSPREDESDSLDEEWVSKAKAIVERTKSDPYVESRELSKAKADFLRVRYNKETKIAEERP